MLRDITLGQYYPADSVIHKLDPRVKLFGTFIYIISLFCFKGIAALAVATRVFVCSHPAVKGAVPLYGKRSSRNHDTDAHHRGIQPVFDTRQCVSCFLEA